MHTYDIICAGEMLIDFTPGKEPYTFTANPGGAPANVAIATARNELSTAFLGILGNDDFGKRLKETLEADRVTLLCPALTDRAITTLAFVTLYEGGERSFSLSDEPSRSAIQYAMKLAHSNHKLVSFDVNYRDMIWHDIEKCKKEVDTVLPYVDLLKISDEELYFVGGEDNIETFMQQYNIRVLIQTLGADGAKYYFNGKRKLIPGKKVAAVDATGAGDAFWGGFLSRLLMYGISNASEITEEMVEAALIYGNTSGGLCVQKMGGIPAIPCKKTILENVQYFKNFDYKVKNPPCNAAKEH